jgi:hypothetical protein
VPAGVQKAFFVVIQSIAPFAPVCSTKRTRRPVKKFDIQSEASGDRSSPAGTAPRSPGWARRSRSPARSEGPTNAAIPADLAAGRIAGIHIPRSDTFLRLPKLASHYRTDRIPQQMAQG